MAADESVFCRVSDGVVFGVFVDCGDNVRDVELGRFFAKFEDNAFDEDGDVVCAFKFEREAPVVGGEFCGVKGKWGVGRDAFVFPFLEEAKWSVDFDVFEPAAFKSPFFEE